MFRPIITKVGSKPLLGFFRSSFPKYKPFASSLFFAPVAKRFVSYQAPAASRSAPHAAQPTNWAKIAGQVGIIGGTIVGLHLLLNRETREGGIPPVEQAYLRQTFKYVAAGLGITALTARGLHLSGWSARLMAMNPWITIAGGLALSIGAHFKQPFY